MALADVVELFIQTAMKYVGAPGSDHGGDSDADSLTTPPVGKTVMMKKLLFDAETSGHQITVPPALWTST